MLIHLRTNLTTRALAALFDTSHSTGDRVIHHLVPVPAHTLRPELIDHGGPWIVDGTLIPVHDQSITARRKTIGASSPGSKTGKYCVNAAAAPTPSTTASKSSPASGTSRPAPDYGSSLRLSPWKTTRHQRASRSPTRSTRRAGASSLAPSIPKCRPPR
ncbi:transposase family protein [Mycobacterium sp.]|uniref:helix-turn-helix domain-containing protein n=1 Tax=Mycobacterium sp. TaxID=1785 RepID=UPI0033412AA1